MVERLLVTSVALLMFYLTPANEHPKNEIVQKTYTHCSSGKQYEFPDGDSIIYLQVYQQNKIIDLIRIIPRKPDIFDDYLEEGEEGFFLKGDQPFGLNPDDTYKNRYVTLRGSQIKQQQREAFQNYLSKIVISRCNGRKKT